MPNLFPQLKNIQWGPDQSQMYDVLRNPRRLPGGNPVLIYRHGGGAIQRDKRLPWIASGNGNPLAYWVFNQSDVPFDVISIGTRQAGWELPLTSHPKSASYGWTSNRMSRGIFPPYSHGLEVKLAIMAIKSRAEELGINPDKMIVMGTSYGGDVAITLGLTAPIYSDEVGVQALTRFGMVGGVDSTVAGIIPHQLCADLRNLNQERPTPCVTTDLTYTDADRRVTRSGAFTYFDQIAAGGQVTVTGGTNAATGLNGVDYVDPAGNYLVLSASLGASANGSTNIAIAYMNPAPTFDLAGCTWNAGTLTLTKTDGFVTFGHEGKTLMVTAGTGATLNVFRIGTRISKDAITLTTSPGANAADYSVYCTGDQGYWFVFRNMMGANDNAQWDKVPRQYKRQLSSLHYLEKNIGTQWWVPTLLVSETTGNGQIPYGALNGGDPHDHRQVATVVNLARSRGLDIEGLVPQAGWDDSDPNRDKVSDKIYTWMKRVVNAAVPPRELGISNTITTQGANYLPQGR